MIQINFKETLNYLARLVQFTFHVIATVGVRAMTMSAKTGRTGFWAGGLFAAGVNLLAVPALAVVLAGIPGPAAAAAQIQSLSSIRQAAKDYVMENLVVDPLRSNVNIGNLDTRLRLRQCDSPLETFDNSGSARGGRSTIGVRCAGGSPWTIYVSAQVDTFAEVYTLAGSMGRGERIRAQDLVLKDMNVGALAFGYFTEADALVGMVLRRTGRPGEVVTPNLVAPPELVKRGETVTVLAKAGNTHVSMQGTAMDNGAMGDRIRVRNSSSNRVVEGNVIGVSRIEIP